MTDMQEVFFGKALWKETDYVYTIVLVFLNCACKHEFYHMQDGTIEFVSTTTKDIGKIVEWSKYNPTIITGENLQ